MDLPKNITQIGEADARCKIYVEDYVVSFLKQLNPLARDKTMAAALYGKRKEEGEERYLFVYGAGKLDFIQKETKHLSQAQRQEIERIRRQYFSDYEFLGYRILDGGMVDGFHVCEQDVCRYVEGYAQFYEKNEAMLSYMLESRQVEATPESVDSEKYEVARGHQEKRREKYGKHVAQAENEEGDKAQRTGLKASVVAIGALLCVLGVAMNSSALKEKGISWEALKSELKGSGLPELMAPSKEGEPLRSEESESMVGAEDGQVLAASGRAQAGSLELETAETGRQEGDGEGLGSTGEKDGLGSEGMGAKDGGEGKTGNAAGDGNGGEGKAGNAADAGNVGDGKAGDAADGGNGGEGKNGEGNTGVDKAGNGSDGKTGNNAGNGGEGKMGSGAGAGNGGGNAKETEEAGGKAQPTVYVAKRGDTLTGISFQFYGSDKYVGQICKLNGIKNPDEIKEGQKILLP